MQSEDFDKRLREAAEHHHPTRHEKSWDKMEKLLDLHLPQKKEKRRRFFFLLFFLLLGGGLWLLIDRPWEGNRQMGSSTGITESGSGKGMVQGLPDHATGLGREPDGPGAQRDEQAAVQSTPDGSPAELRPGAGPANGMGVTGPGTGEREERAAPAGATTRSNTGKEDIIAAPEKLPADKAGAVPARKSGKQVQVKPERIENRVVSEPVRPAIAKPEPAVVDPQPVIRDPQPIDANPNPRVPISGLDQGIQEKAPKPAGDSMKGIPAGTDSLVAPQVVMTGTPDTAVNLTRKPKRKRNSLSVSISAGPDISMVGWSRAGKWQVASGAGISYTFHDRISISTGFYSARKIYTASPEQYKPDVGLTNTTYLESIDADCRVYEIPLSVAYHFGKAGSHSWFASTGLSSFLMRKESYDYLYNYPGGAYVHNYSMENEFRHFFSVLSLSGGYTRELGKTFSLSAEPYLKLPLAGVGYGNIKLNSGGVLFTLRARLTGTRQ